MGCFNSKSTAVCDDVVENKVVKKHQPLDQLEASHHPAEKEEKHHCFVDYRGVTSSTARPSSKSSSDNVCLWADKVLAVREKIGEFADPEDPSLWPREAHVFLLNNM